MESYYGDPIQFRLRGLSPDQQEVFKWMTADIHKSNLTPLMRSQLIGDIHAEIQGMTHEQLQYQVKRMTSPPPTLLEQLSEIFYEPSRQELFLFIMEKISEEFFMSIKKWSFSLCHYASYDDFMRDQAHQIKNFSSEDLESHRGLMTALKGNDQNYVLDTQQKHQLPTTLTIHFCLVKGSRVLLTK